MCCQGGGAAQRLSRRKKPIVIRPKMCNCIEGRSQSHKDTHVGGGGVTPVNIHANIGITLLHLIYPDKR